MATRLDKFGNAIAPKATSKPGPKLSPEFQRLFDAMKRAEDRRDRQTRNQRLGRDPVTGRAPMFESTPRKHVSPLGGVAVESKKR
jgi:hypothetical protein